MQSFAHSDAAETGKAAAAPRIHDSGAMSIETVAKSAGLSVSTVKRAIRDKKLKAKKFGRRTLVIGSDYHEWLHGLPAA